jgi:hypothetical protein
MSKKQARIAELQAEADKELEYAATLASVFGGGDATVEYCIWRRERILAEIRKLKKTR